MTLHHTIISYFSLTECLVVFSSLVMQSWSGLVSIRAKFSLNLTFILDASQMISMMIIYLNVLFVFQMLNLAEIQKLYRANKP